MDIQKEHEAFEAWLFKEYPDAKDFMIVYRPDENIYEHRPTQVRWEAWQAAKAQAVPEGYKVVPVNYECVWCGCTELDGWTDETMLEAQESK